MIKNLINRIFSKKSASVSTLTDAHTAPSFPIKKQREKHYNFNKQKKNEVEKFKKSLNKKLSDIFNNPEDCKRGSSLKKQEQQEKHHPQTNKSSQNNFTKHDRNKSDYRSQFSKKNKKVAHSSNSFPTIEAKQSVFNSDKDFSSFGLSTQLVKCLTANNFSHPSKVQEQALPIILNQKNLICSSETGSGKTLAFVIPILEKFLTKKIDQVCILTPTREIAIQIETVIKPLAQEMNITTGLAIGGMDMLVQKKILRDYPQILIATPGRLADVSSQGWVWLDYTSLIVLDEVDRMLDMGFEKEISALFEVFPSTAQILMFTATMNKELEKLSQNYVKNYELIKVGETMKTKSSIEHLFLSLPARDKYQTLKSILKRKSEEKVLVFFNSIDETIKTYQQLKKDRLQKINCLHSRKTQDERNQVLNAFRNNRINHLLTTDVLARGIDIPNIDAVVNYELPRDSEDYIHRIGRTGRADFLGKALSFVDKKSEIKLKKIKQLIKSDQGFNFIGLKSLNNF